MAKNKTIKLPRKQFAEYVRLNEEAAGIRKQMEQIKDSWNEAGLLPKASKKTAGEYVVIDEKKDEQGKATIFFKAGFQMPDMYILRIN